MVKMSTLSMSNPRMSNRLLIGSKQVDQTNPVKVHSAYVKHSDLAFVPLNFVRVSWDGLKAEMPDDEWVESFVIYIDQTWINGNFRPRMWNYYAHTGPRTNNHLEGWHNRMKRISRKAHPNLYEILELFQREQAATEVAIQQLEAGGVRKPKRKKVIRCEDKIKSLAN